MSSSSLIITPAEEKVIDSQVEQMMDWAKTRRAEAEQLALDSALLLSCVSDRVDTLNRQNFFKRCWNRFIGKAGEMERANASDIIQMQKVALRYVNMLQEQQLLIAHSLLVLKSNMLALAVREEETRNLVGLLAQRTAARFDALERRTDQLEISTNLQGWLLTLAEYNYEKKYPIEIMRLFCVINDFYNIKNDNWNYNDLIFMRSAIRAVGINPNMKISLNMFIDRLTDEIIRKDVDVKEYDHIVTMLKPDGVYNYSKYVVENISSQIFITIQTFKEKYIDSFNTVDILHNNLNISTSDAIKRLIRHNMSNMNINLNYEFTVAEMAIEILGCIRLGRLLAEQHDKWTDYSSIPNKEKQFKETDSVHQNFIINHLRMTRWNIVTDENLCDSHLKYGDTSKNNVVLFKNNFYRTTEIGLFFWLCVIFNR